MVARIIWGALLMGQFAFMGVVAFLLNGGFEANVEVGQLVFYAAIAALLTGVPTGYVIRMQTYKKHWRENVITPQGYMAGNIILLAICEGASILGLIATLLSGAFGLPLAVCGLAMGVQIVNFPNGKPMFESLEDASPQ